METNALDHGPGPREAEEVARDLFGLASPRVLPLSGGRVNATFRVDSGGASFILQRLSPFFQADEALGLNWRHIAQTLAERAAPPLVPPIFPDLAGRWLAIRPGRGGAWRLTGFRSGRPVSKNPAGAGAAARAMGWLHQGLNRPVPIQLRPLPAGEFTNRRLASLEELALWPERYRGHPHWPALHPHWEKMAAAVRDLPFHSDFLDVFRLREVVIHGDPKADNFLQSETGEILAVLDWDTAGLGHVLAEVGEMLRSFGAAAATGEEVSAAAAVVEGYAETGLALTEAEVELLPAVWRALALNLSRRYLTDALAEVYFLWDRLGYPSLYEQNRSRGAALLDLAGRLLEREMELIERFQAAARRGGGRKY
jgi:Ser/Thr protein kinase RdoA (MazF antagonist)